jgi:uncharacterized protein (DUF983 family)
VGEDPATILMRGVFKKCPRCGQGHLFRRWLQMPATCPRCGLRFEREEGAFLGSLTINYAVTGVVFFALLIGWMVIGGSDHIAWAPLILASLGVIVVVPLAFYPFAKTIWAAIDYLMYRGDPTHGQPGASASGQDERPGD